jgi:hypothetical protein
VEKWLLATWSQSACAAYRLRVARVLVYTHMRVVNIFHLYISKKYLYTLYKYLHILGNTKSYTASSPAPPAVSTRACASVRSCSAHYYVTRFVRGGLKRFLISCLGTDPSIRPPSFIQVSSRVVKLYKNVQRVYGVAPPYLTRYPKLTTLVL